MYPNALDTFVASVKHQREMVIVHRVTGGYLTHNGDLQIETDPIDKIDNKRHLWVVHLEGYYKNNTVYSFENKREGKRLAINPDDPRDGMRFTDAQDPKGKLTKEMEAQRFYVLPMCNGGYSIVPFRAPDLGLMPMGNRPTPPACDRPSPHYGGQSSDNGAHDFVRPPEQPPREDPTNQELQPPGSGK
ncbi:hypothetical protein DF17_17010 [Streptomyces rimosus]|uniref:hypothetical protein n=1 Tax=Streptomyces rimosus TaxID=1927 RepID=UPI0004DB0909|nr:hypothetical protein [Streptomyces rimosus]KEF05899.1 hypothetical protein DF17_17010 [Streptomyces rimosus]